MKRSGLLIIILIVGFGYAAHSQQTRLDSLLKVNNTYQKEDSTKVLLLIDLYKEYRKLKLSKERFQYGEAATALGEKIKFTRPLPVIYNAIALYYEGRSEYEKSIANYTRAIELAELAGDKENAAVYTLNYGTVYHTLADYPRALTLYQKAANYYISMGNEDDAALCFINMGGVYQEFAGQYAKAVEFINKALAIFLKSGESENRGVAEAYLSIADSYLSAADADLKQMNVDPARKYQICRQYADKAMNIAVISKDEDLRAQASSLAGKIEEMQSNYSAALEQYRVSLMIHQKANRPNYAYTAMLDIGRVYKKQRDFTGSITYLQMALAGGRQIKAPDQQKDALLNLSEVHEALHHYDSAYFYYRQYIVMRDSISNTEKQKEITRKVLQFEFGVKEREYQLNQQIADGKIKQQEGIAIRQQQEISLRNKQLELTNREKEIQKLNYLKKQSELESAQKLQAIQLNEKVLEQKIQNQTINEQQAQISAENKITLFFGILAIIVSGAAFFVYRAMKKTARLNKLVSAQKEELEEMGKVKDKIFSIVSHDMRAPVNNLVAFSSILEEGHVSQEKLLLYIDQIKGTLDHTSTMMENLLNWAASQMQGFTPLTEEVSLVPIIENIHKGMEPALQKKNISFVNTVLDEILVMGDRNMIELIIRNLLNNAVKFTEINGRIEIKVIQQADRIKLEVKDTGVGLSDHKLKLINADSVRTLESTAGTDKEKGTGLGLMLSKHFALLMKGKIIAESRQGSGSVFALSLPVGGDGVNRKT
jgi:signal transduction histidine kinase